MKDKFFKFCEKFIAGGYETKIGNTYVGTPKVAPIFLVAFIMTAIGEIKNIGIVEYTGWFLILVGIFGFFYYNIFPSRRPLERISEINKKKKK